MKRLQILADRLARPLPFAALAFLVINSALALNLLDLPISIARLRALSGETVLDMTFFYTPARAYAMLEAYGEAGRRLYLIGLFTADLALPLLMALLFLSGLTYTWRRAGIGPVGLAALSYVALGGLLADYLENLGIFGLLMSYPTRVDVLAAITSVFTLVKHVIYSGAALGVLAGLAATVVRARRHGADLLPRQSARD
jgi:hypothetical protein